MTKSLRQVETHAVRVNDFVADIATTLNTRSQAMQKSTQAALDGGVAGN